MIAKFRSRIARCVNTQWLDITWAVNFECVVFRRVCFFRTRAAPNEVLFSKRATHTQRKRKTKILCLGSSFRSKIHSSATSLRANLPRGTAVPLNNDDDDDYIALNIADELEEEEEIMSNPEKVDEPQGNYHRPRRKRKRKRRKIDSVGPEEELVDPEELPPRARWTIVATACLLLAMSLLLVGVTLRMAPIIDDMGESRRCAIANNTWIFEDRTSGERITSFSNIILSSDLIIRAWCGQIYSAQVICTIRISFVTFYWRDKLFSKIWGEKQRAFCARARKFFSAVCDFTNAR